MLDFEKRMVMAGKEKLILLVDKFSRHQVPNVASQLRVTKLVFLPLNTTSRFNLWMQVLLHLLRIITGS